MIKEAVRKAKDYGWIQTQMIFNSEISPLSRDEDTENYNRTKQPFMYLADVEKMILDIFEDDELKNCMVLGVLNDKSK